MSRMFFSFILLGMLLPSLAYSQINESYKSFLQQKEIPIFIPFVTDRQMINPLPSAVQQQLETALRVKERGNWEQSFQILKKLADRGDPISQYYVAMHYAGGMNVAPVIMNYRDTTSGAPDDKQAFEWFSKSAASSYPPALVEKGRMLIMGSGTPKDRDQGIKSMMAAATYGSEEGLLFTCLANEQYLKDVHNTYYWCLLSSRHPDRQQPDFDTMMAMIIRALEAKLRTGEIQSITEKANSWKPKVWEYPTNLLKE